MTFRATSESSAGHSKYANTSPNRALQFPLCPCSHSHKTHTANTDTPTHTAQTTDPDLRPPLRVVIHTQKSHTHTTYVLHVDTALQLPASLTAHAHCTQMYTCDVGIRTRPHTTPQTHPPYTFTHLSTHHTQTPTDAGSCV